MTPTEVRLQLLRGGFHPLPLFGKAPSMLKNWQERFNTNANDIAMWPKQWADATNTGALCRDMPTLDADVLHAEALEAVKELLAERFEERGFVLVRTGKAPKFAVPFRTDAPFAKITANLIAPDGSPQKIEFLCDGQQVVVDGIHPETGKPYTWHPKRLCEIEHNELPYITGAEAQQLVNDVVRLLVEQFGFKQVGEHKKTDGNGQETGAGADWDALIGNVLDGVALHDSLRDLAASCIAKGVKDGDTIELLRTLMRKSSAPRDDRFLERNNEIPRMVRSARAKFGGEAVKQQEPPEFTSPSNGKAFGYSWQWHWHGETDPIDSRKWMVDQLLPETGAGLISGQWGTYKTFVADDLAAAVMTGEPFINFPVTRKGGVLFFACEGQNEVVIRLTAAFEAKGGVGRAPFAWVENCPRLLDPNASKILASMVKHAAAKMMQDFGLPVSLVIIDTAGKAAGLLKSGDLNDDAIAKIIMKALAETSAETGALFVGVAHFGKNVETGTKGSTGFEDDADVVLALLGEKGINGVVTTPRLCARKRRTGPNGAEFPFRTNVVDLGVDPQGRAITTLTIEWLAETGASPAKPKEEAWAKSLRLLRQTLMNMLADCGSEQQPFLDGPVVRAVDLELVRAEFYKSYPATGDEQAKKAARQKAFKRAVKDAGDKGLIGTRDIGAVTFVWLATPAEHA